MKLNRFATMSVCIGTLHVYKPAIKLSSSTTDVYYMPLTIRILPVHTYSAISKTVIVRKSIKLEERCAFPKATITKLLIFVSVP